jgi:hypothetical protein
MAGGSLFANNSLNIDLWSPVFDCATVTQRALRRFAAERFQMAVQRYLF